MKPHGSRAGAAGFEPPTPPCRDTELLPFNSSGVIDEVR
jgi:hypothetical protein